ncbi:MAG TPA: O-antigen ligase family protein [Rhodothermales bacterium]|nr:O-antigen ligase family protein [Rhodothermales bacterium]
MTPQTLLVPEAVVYSVGRLGLSIILGLCLLVLFFVVWTAPHLTPFFPLAIISGIGFLYLLRNPLLHLSLVIASFALVADFDEGIDVGEVLFGLFYASYLGIWLFRRVFLQREKLLESTIDFLMVAILVLVTVHVFVGWLWGAAITSALREWQSWTMLAFYFPVKDACRRYPHGTKAMLIVIVAAALFVAVRNVIELKSLVSAAGEVWQITKKGRVIANEIILVTGGLVALAAVTHFRRLRWIMLASGLLVTFLLGLILTQSRSYWLSFAFGALAMVMLSDRAGRSRIAVITSVAVGGGLTLVLLLFGDLATLLFAGLLDRVLSLAGGATDMSLVNRMLEISAAWQWIRHNPILGYGLGTEFSFFDLTISGTRTWAFIHNGYVGLLYKFGIPGAILIMTFWIGSIVRGVRSVRRNGLDSWNMKGCLVSVGVLASLLVSGMTANPFFLSDTLLVFGVFGGVCAGASSASEKSESHDPPLSP